MSTKFNNSKNLQPTPKICRKGPDGWKWEDYVFNVYALQAYALWHDPFTPLDASVAGVTILDAYPLQFLHFGIVTGERHTIEIDLLYYPAIEEFTLTLQLCYHGSPIDSVSKTWNEPAPVIPWHTDLIIWRNPPAPRYVECKIFS